MHLFKPRSLYLNLVFQLLIVWFFMFLYRLVFVINNSSFFPDFGLFDFLVGSWFDLITMSFFFLPFIIIGTVPLLKSLERFRRPAKLIVFIPSTVIIFFLNAWDIAFFSFTRKRVSYNYFKFLFGENEAGGLAFEYMAEFWWLILFFIATLFIICYVALKLKDISNNFNVWYSWGLFFGFIVVSVVTGRGGFQLKPIDIIEVTK